MATYSLALHLWSHSCVLATQMGVALDHSARFEFARGSTRYEQMGTILTRPLRRLLGAGSIQCRHTGWVGAALCLNTVPAQASLPLKMRLEALVKEISFDEDSGQLVINLYITH